MHDFKETEEIEKYQALQEAMEDNCEGYSYSDWCA